MSPTDVQVKQSKDETSIKRSKEPTAEVRAATVAAVTKHPTWTGKRLIKHLRRSGTHLSTGWFHQWRKETLVQLGIKLSPSGMARVKAGARRSVKRAAASTGHTTPGLSSKLRSYIKDLREPLTNDSIKAITITLPDDPEGEMAVSYTRVVSMEHKGLL